MSWRGEHGDGKRNDGGCSDGLDSRDDADAAVTHDPPPPSSLPSPPLSFGMCARAARTNRTRGRGGEESFRLVRNLSRTSAGRRRRSQDAATRRSTSCRGLGAQAAVGGRGRNED